MPRLSRFAPFEIFVYCVVTLMGFAVAVTGYQHGLPFIDYPDEMTMWTRGRATIDPTWDMFQPEYPPGMVWLSAVVQQMQIAQGDPFINPAGATQIGRLTSVLAFTVTLVLLLLLARALFDEETPPFIRLTASIVAGLGWLCLPLAVRHARYAMPDCWLCMWFVASLLAAVTAWKRSSERWLWLSVVFGVLATVFKWQAAVVFAAGGVCCLRFWPDHARTLRLVLTYGVIVAAFGAWVVFGRHALEGGLYMPGTTPNVPTPFTVLDNLVYQSVDIGSGWIFGVLPLVCFLLLFVKPLRQRIHLVPLLMLPLMILALNIILSINGSRLFPRHYLPALALMAGLAGVGVGLLLAQINRISFGRTARLAVSVIVVIIVCLPLVGMARDVVNETGEQTRPDRRVLLMDWLAANARDKVTVITDVNLASAADPLYGYRGAKITTPEWGAYIPSNEVTDAMLQTENVRYLVAPAYITFDQLTTPLTPLLTNGDDATLRGETWIVYQVGDMQGLRSADAYITFGDSIQLRGFAIEPTNVCAGTDITLDLSWGAVTTPTRYYAFFLHLANDPQGELSAPINGQQPVGDSRPTITWTRADELLIADPITATIPADVPAGTYDLWLGLFEPEGTERLYLPDGKHYAVVGQIEVEAC
ncbi:MAG: hypothetical protein LCI00_23785 [Chloroflexi bacterium]|nr:hypothetical protein [Chloroflexota bacterium]MCC6896078.1 hypothetical protein [Anaerolineae bacterium]